MPLLLLSCFLPDRFSLFSALFSLLLGADPFLYHPALLQPPCLFSLLSFLFPLLSSLDLLILIVLVSLFSLRFPPFSLHFPPAGTEANTPSQPLAVVQKASFRDLWRLFL